MVNWEKNWRGAGLGAALFFIVWGVIYGDQPGVGASADELVSFYDGDSTRILISSVIFGFAVLNLTWFAVAIGSLLRDAGKGGWGAAASAAGAAVAAVYFVLVTVRTGLAYSIAGSGNTEIVSGLNDLTWVLMVFGWFPLAMLVMATSFGLHRAGIFSGAAFGVGITAMVLLLLGTTTLAGDGFWAADGAYARVVPTIVMLVWLAGVSVFLVRRLSKESAPGAAAVPAA